jgi:hypothetical protein
MFGAHVDSVDVAAKGLDKAYSIDADLQFSGLLVRAPRESDFAYVVQSWSGKLLNDCWERL